jgi:ribosomal-protein-alanine N-acetyltransferase
LSFYVRRMYQEDVDQVTEIDREAFPTQWPPPNYQREIQNRLSHYIVVCDNNIPIEKPEEKVSTGKSLMKPGSIWSYLFRRHDSSGNQLPPSLQHSVIGFSGFWVLAEEAHISSIAVREAFRRTGIGELLLISVFTMAAELKARIVTLEVRASNTTAQNLYTKYGFMHVGIRRGYYNDNREDGLIMTTENITSEAFQAKIKQLKQALSERLDIDRYQIIR